MHVLIKVAILIILLMAGGAASLPETLFDALHYHLALPAQWLMGERPQVLFADFPPGPGGLYAIALWVGGEGGAKMLNFLMGVACLWPLGMLARRLTGRPEASWLAILAFIASPVVSVNFTGCQADLAMTFFLLSALTVFLNLEPSWRWRGGWGGLLLGGAMWMKYTAWVLAPVILAWWGFYLWKVENQDLKTSASAAWWGGGIALLVISPWAVRNLLLHSAPLAPYGLHLGAGFERLLQEQRGAPGSLFTWLHQTFVWSPWASSWAGVHWLILPWAGFLLIRQGQKPLHLFSLLALALLLVSISVSRVVRFLLPSLALLSVIAAHGLIAPRTPAWLIAGWIGLIGVQQGQLWISKRWWDEVPAYWLGQTSRAQYLSRPHPEWGYPNPSWAAFSVLHDEPKNAKVLCVGETRVFHSPRPALFGTAYQTPPLTKMLGQSATPDHLAKVLQSQGVTHLLVNQRENERLRRAYGFSHLEWRLRESKLYHQFLRTHVKPIYRSADGSLALYRLIPMDRRS